MNYEEEERKKEGGEERKKVSRYLAVHAVRWSEKKKMFVEEFLEGERWKM